jgi:hypothetical protein
MLLSQFGDTMITLYSYPQLFGVADNNGYGLKVFAFTRLAGVPFTHEHIFDASAVPRGQLPYMTDDGETIGDSATIIGHLNGKYRLSIDAALTVAQRDTNILVTRMLDDLYWVMSYSRWKDERYWPKFCSALMREHPTLTEAGLRKAQEFFSAIIFRASAGTRRMPPTPAVSPILRSCHTSCRRQATCTGPNRPASMRASTASSPTSISTTSIRR